ncbi:serine hydrolase [Amycolatopsis sp. MtRt-6]|uniref:serine hydrolase n=1 Tax=Amycolatopsis sp. MtRt-6 TaxID=2792782 RepID=UPI001A8D62BB|nr:serine hydrolase [Amycolatopsis sp. MtRt-6]
MLRQLDNVKVRVALAAVLVVGGVLTAVALNSGSGSDSWRAACGSAPAGPAGKQASVVAEARKALLDTGNDPRLGIEIVDLAACAVETSWKADQPQPAASVVKLLIALDLIDRSGMPSDSEATAVRAMVSASDDRVASRLWQQNGGAEIVRRQAAKLGLTHTEPPADPGKWGSTRMSPTDVITVYRYITAGLSEEGREFLTEAMGSAPRTAADGFDQHFGIPRAFPGAAWAVKQGWGSSESRRVLNTTGLVRTASRTYAVAVMASWRDTIDWPTATAAVTTAVGALKGSLRAAKV